jgi:hypoxanthine phosphoribosyltransferase
MTVCYPRGGTGAELGAVGAHAGDRQGQGAMDRDQVQVLINEEQLQRRVRELSEAIVADYCGLRPVLICALKGAFFFMADLSRLLPFDLEIEFMAVSSYGRSTDSSGVVRILKDLDIDIEGRHVLIVEDIIDSGLTLQYLVNSLGSRGPASLEVVTLLNKPSRRQAELVCRYTGFDIPDHFVVGYGLDYAEQYRNLPFIGFLDGLM